MTELASESELNQSDSLRPVTFHDGPSSEGAR